MIPVYASLLVPARIAISGDPKRFLERVAKIQAGLLICVYCLSHAPAILSLELTTSPGGERWRIGTPAQVAVQSPGESEAAPESSPPPATESRPLGSNASVLFFFVLMV